MIEEYNDKREKEINKFDEQYKDLKHLKRKLDLRKDMIHRLDPMYGEEDKEDKEQINA